MSETNNIVTQIDVIRHGEPEGGRRYRGSSIDDPLSEKGWQQMWDAVPEQAEWEHIISSPLARCVKFSEALADSLKINFSIEDNLKEIGFGSWEGRTSEDIQQNESEALEKFLLDPVNNRPQGAEPLNDFADRVWPVYESIAQQYKGQHVLVVAHAGVIRAISSKILGMALDDVYSNLKIEYAAIATTKIYNANKPVLVLT